MRGAFRVLAHPAMLCRSFGAEATPRLPINNVWIPMVRRPVPQQYDRPLADPVGYFTTLILRKNGWMSGAVA